MIKSKNINFICTLIGTNVNKNNINLVNDLKKLKLFKYVKLLGRNNNIPQVMNGLDIHVLSSSYGEGFPNVIAEADGLWYAMCATDVGDSCFIVGKTGWVVPPNNTLKLAKVIENALYEIGSDKWNKRCNKARLIIKKNLVLII